MVLHGGDNGQLNKYGLDDQHVFRWTQKQLQSKIDLGGGERIPTLEALIKLSLSRPNMLLNIELKGPWDEEYVSQYDYNLAAKKVIQLIDKYNVAERVMISSFVPRIIDSVISASSPDRKFIIQSLRNRRGLPDPASYAMFEQTTGINIMLQYMTEARIKKVQKSGHLVGLWYSVFRNPIED